MLLDRECEATSRPLLEALLAARGWGTPESRAAAVRLLDRHAPWGTDLAPGEAFLVGAPSPHQASLFFDWLEGSRDRTLDAIGRPRGMNGPAVGDAVARAGRRIRAVLGEAPPPWPWLVAELRQRLGSVTTEELLAGALERLGAARGSRSASLAAWLAGPYVPVRGHPGWLARDPWSLLARSARAVRADGGVRRLTDVAAELADLQLAAGTLVPWLQEFGGAVVHDLVVATAGALTDAVERVLDAHGTARTVAQIAEDLAAGGRCVPEPTLAVAVRGRRFRATDEGAVWLAAWGDAGTKGSRRSPARGDGRARVRGAAPTRAVSRPPGAPERGDPAGGGRRRGPPGNGGRRSPRPSGATAEQPVPVWLSVRVDEAVLRGEEAAAPVELAERLGLGAQGRRTFSSRWGPVTLAYEGSQPTRGSLRAVARAVGARPGATLLLGFSPAGHVAVELRGPARPDPGSPAGGAATADADGLRAPGTGDAIVRDRAVPAPVSAVGHAQTLFPDTTYQGAR